MCGAVSVRKDTVARCELVFSLYILRICFVCVSVRVFVQIVCIYQDELCRNGGCVNWHTVGTEWLF